MLIYNAAYVSPNSVILCTLHILSPPPPQKNYIDRNTENKYLTLSFNDEN